MSERKDGGPAYPALNYVIPHDLEERHVAALGKTQGMTLRDYFAGQALAGLASAHDAEGGWTCTSEDAKYAAAHAYAIADAMIAERSK